MTYFVAIHGQQQGPFQIDQIQSMMDAGQIQPGDLCWAEGMADWQPLALTLPGLTQRQAPLFAPPAVHNPYAPPSSAYAAPSSPRQIKGSYKGIGRLPYFLSFIGIQILSFAGMAMMDAGSSSGLPVPGLVLLIALSVASIFFLVQRMRNTGSSPWLLLLLLVPGLNVLFALALGFYLLISPEGYADHRTLDTPGKVMTWIVVGGAGLLLVMLLISMALGSLT